MSKFTQVEFAGLLNSLHGGQGRHSSYKDLVVVRSKDLS